jgi:hypothetical protein
VSFQTLLLSDWVVTVSHDKVEGNKVIILLFMLFISLNGLLVYACSVDIFVILPFLMVEGIRQYF